MTYSTENNNLNIPKGFLFSAVKSGLKNNDYDMALIVSNPYSKVAGMYTNNKFSAPPVVHSKENDKNEIKALLINSQIANSGTGKEGMKDVSTYTKMLAKKLNCKNKNILTASTGRMGIPLKMDNILKGIDLATESLSENTENLARAICTNDKIEKSLSVSVSIEGVDVNFFIIAKGNSSVHPNMATVLLFIFTDANVEQDTLKMAFNQAINKTINRISIDNDTSTNDSAIIMANGKANNKLITVDTPKNYKLFVSILEDICYRISMMILQDGEGVKKIAKIHVKNAKTESQALEIAKSIATSTIIKISLDINKIDPIKLLSIASQVSSDFDPNISKIKINGYSVYEKSKMLDLNESHEFLNSMKTKNEYLIEIDCGFKTKIEDYYIFTDLNNDYISFNKAYNI